MICTHVNTQMPIYSDDRFGHPEELNLSITGPLLVALRHLRQCMLKRFYQVAIELR